MKTYRVSRKGPRGGQWKTIFKEAFGYTEKNGRFYFHHQEDLKDFDDFIDASSVSGIEPMQSGPPDFDYQLH